MNIQIDWRFQMIKNTNKIIKYPEVFPTICETCEYAKLAASDEPCQACTSNSPKNPNSKYLKTKKILIK